MRYKINDVMMDKIQRRIGSVKMIHQFNTGREEEEGEGDGEGDGGEGVRKSEVECLR